MPKLGSNLNCANAKITNLGDPTSAQDGATKNYVDEGMVNRYPSASISVPENYCLVVVRKYSLSASVKISLGDNSILRIM